MQVGALGSFIFSVSDEQIRTWSQRDWDQSDRWEVIDVIESGQIAFFGGRNLAVGRLTVSLHPDYSDARSAVDELERLRGQAHRLSLGKRIFPKPYVLESYSESEDGQGVVELSLQLREYNARAPNTLSTGEPIRI